MIAHCVASVRRPLFVGWSFIVELIDYTIYRRQWRWWRPRTTTTEPYDIVYSATHLLNTKYTIGVGIVETWIKCIPADESNCTMIRWHAIDQRLVSMFQLNHIDVDGTLPCIRICSSWNGSERYEETKRNKLIENWICGLRPCQLTFFLMPQNANENLRSDENMSATGYGCFVSYKKWHN